MFRPRVIPTLLLKNKGLVKSIRFSKYNYIGDPINAVKIFNDLESDELIFLDINATKEDRRISIDFVKRVGAEANMPFGVGGGIKSIHDIREILEAGAEKVILNTHIFNNHKFLLDSVKEFGSSTISVSIDVKKRIFRGNEVYIRGGKKSTGIKPLTYAKMIQDLGVGEIIIQSIDNDGMMNGYDIELIKSISENVYVPVVALGGARDIPDLIKAIKLGSASAVSAGSMFVYHGPRNAVLINYPNKEELIAIQNL